MKGRWLHIALVTLLLVQGTAAVHASATMLTEGLAVSESSPAGSESLPCHETAPEPASCCEGMQGIACGMDCGTPSPALNHVEPSGAMIAHEAWLAGGAAALQPRAPTSLYKPPRTY